MAEKQQPLLNLDTLVEHRTVRIRYVGADGQPTEGEYDLLNTEEVSILDYHRIAKQTERVHAMMGSKDMTDEQAVDLSSLLDELCKFVLKAPAEVHAKIVDLNKLRVLEAFTNLHREPTAVAPMEEKQSTSAS